MIIIHRCLRCGHPDIFHGRRWCCYSWCRCATPHWSEPQLMLTYASGPWRLIDRITPPGTRTPEFGPLCNCHHCQDFYVRQ